MMTSGSSARLFTCAVNDSAGSGTIPRAVLTAAGGGEAPNRVSLTLTRTRASIQKGLTTVGTLTTTHVEPEGWVEVVTTSMETHTFEGCSSYESLCGDACIETDYDEQNCGTCGNVCAANQTCSEGECVLACEYPLENCGGFCVNVLTNTTHCGGCNESCSTGEACDEGYCFTPAPSGWTCEDYLYGDLYCDCGCGILDPDCISAQESACDACYCASCNSTSNWLCD